MLPNILRALAIIALAASFLIMLVSFFLVDRGSGGRWSGALSNIIQAMFIFAFPIAAAVNLADERTHRLEKRAYQAYFSSLLFAGVLFLIRRYVA
jgi:hypothetical protein